MSNRAAQVLVLAGGLTFLVVMLWLFSALKGALPGIT